MRTPRAHLREILENVRRVLAIELLTACQAIDLRPDGPARLGRGTANAYAGVRRRVPMVVHDRQTAGDIEALAELILGGTLMREA